MPASSHVLKVKEVAEVASTQSIGGTAAGQVLPVGQQVMPLLAESVPPGQLAVQEVKASLDSALIVQSKSVCCSTAATALLSGDST